MKYLMKISMLAVFLFALTVNAQDDGAMYFVAFFFI